MNARAAERIKDRRMAARLLYEIERVQAELARRRKLPLATLDAALVRGRRDGCWDCGLALGETESCRLRAKS